MTDDVTKISRSSGNGAAMIRYYSERRPVSMRDVIGNRDDVIKMRVGRSHG